MDVVFMPSYWIKPRTKNDQNLNFESQQSFDTSFELSEDFYGLMGGNYNATFEGHFKIFTQICQIADVSFDCVFPVFISIKSFEDYTDGYDYTAMNNRVNEISKDLSYVLGKFKLLYTNLSEREGWQKELSLQALQYTPSPEYFMNFGIKKIKNDLLETEDYEESNFEEDLEYVIAYMEFTEKHGSRLFWFEGL